jgi:cell division septum initiation protein DivIVA
MAHSEVRGDHGGNGEAPESEERQPRERETKTVTGHPEAKSMSAREANTAAQEADKAQARERPSSRFAANRVTPAERDRMVTDARDIRFPAALRGYERVAVDRYVREVNRLIAELEISSSPESAIRHALDEVSEETRDILQHAHQTAEEVTARSRSKADDRLQQAESEAQELREASQREAEETRVRAAAEAHEMRELASVEARELREASLRESEQLRDSATRDAQQLRDGAQQEAEELRTSARREADEVLADAETRARDLTHSAEAIWRERRRLIEDMRAVGEQLVALGEAESRRFPRFAEDVAHALEPLRGRSAEAAEAGPTSPTQE